MIEINTDVISAESSDIKSLLNKIDRAYDDVRYVRSQVSSKVQRKKNIKGRLNQAKRDISDIEDEVRDLYKLLDFACDHYDRCERTIKQRVNQISDIKVMNVHYSGGRGTDFESGQKEQTKDQVVNKASGAKASWLGKYGEELGAELAKGITPVGGLFSAAYRTGDMRAIYDANDVTGKYNAYADKVGDVKDLISGGLSMADDLSQVNKLSNISPAYASHVGAKHVVGLNSALSYSSKASHFGTRLTTNWHTAINQQTTMVVRHGGKVSALGTAAKWAGPILTIAERGIQNVVEVKSGEISAARGVTEFAMESAIGIGTTILVGAAVTATVAAAVGSAPVLLVAAGTALVMAGLNFGAKKLSKKIYGEEKGLIEFVSDGIIDGSMALGESAAKLTKAGIRKSAELIDEGIEALDDFKEEAISKITSGTKSLFDGLVNCTKTVSDKVVKPRWVY